MLNIAVNFDFCFMKKLWDVAHEKLVNIQGGHHVGTNIHGWQLYLKIAIYVLISANGGLLCRPLYVRHSAISKDSPLYNRTNPCGNHDYLFLIYLCEWELRSKQGNQSVYSLLN